MYLQQSRHNHGLRFWTTDAQAGKLATNLNAAHVPTRYLVGTNNVRSAKVPRMLVLCFSEALPGFPLSRAVVREMTLVGHMTLESLGDISIRGLSV